MTEIRHFLHWRPEWVKPAQWWRDRGSHPAVPHGVGDGPDECDLHQIYAAGLMSDADVREYEKHRADPFHGCVPSPSYDGPDEELLPALEKVSAESSKPKGTLQNVLSVLMKDPRWAGKIRWNEFTSRLEFHHTPIVMGEVVEAEDHLDTYAAAWLADNYNRMTAPTSRITEAVVAVAHRHTYHPVRRYLESLEWDGEPRIAVFLTDYLGVERTILNDAISSCFLLSCVARVMRPGCKVDTVVILVGAQGALKSTAIRALSGAEWFADTRLDIGSKDVFEQIRGRWLYEIAELDAFKGRDSSRIKSIVSSGEDNYRRPYGHHSSTAKRQVVFVGTTNEDTFLTDPTGARRFWPVRVTSIDVEAIERDRDQLWAEAFHRFKAGEEWWLPKELEAPAAKVAEDYTEADGWEDILADYLSGRETQGVKPDELLRGPLGLHASELTKAHSTRLGIVMKRLGWRRERPMVDGARGYVYLKVRWQVGQVGQVGQRNRAA